MHQRMPTWMHTRTHRDAHGYALSAHMWPLNVAMELCITSLAARQDLHCRSGMTIRDSEAGYSSITMLLSKPSQAHQGIYTAWDWQSDRASLILGGQ